MKGKLKTFISGLLTIAMLLSTAPTFVFAAQSNEYVDPADSWISANGRTNELDVNATTTYETQYCFVCDKHTTVITYRVPEYTKSGETALNRGVMYSDSTLIGGEGTGNLDDGTPGVNAYYTSYHWTKAVCQNCGTINTINGPDSYGYNRNVYNLNSCDHNFFLEFDNTTYEQYNDTYHTTIYKAGEYCQFCKGTSSIAEREREAHNFIEHVDGQVSNNRFYITETCEDCGFVTSEYVAAKSVVSSYYGEVDGNAHTVSVEDLSESGVHTSIRYGTSADDCYLTSAPNYTEAGYYPVYYEIDYRYSGNSITENGVSYVWLLEEDDDTIILIPPTKDEAHEHDYHYLETIEPNCENLGYDRFQCNGCGDLIKTNYIQSTGHKHEAITIREATCKQSGLKLWICGDCGDFYEETTPLGEHTYKTKNVNPTCKSVGYKEHTCELCGDSYITDMFEPFAMQNCVLILFLWSLKDSRNTLYRDFKYCTSLIFWPKGLSESYNSVILKNLLKLCCFSINNFKVLLKNTTLHFSKEIFASLQSSIKSRYSKLLQTTKIVEALIPFKILFNTSLVSSASLIPKKL